MSELAWETVASFLHRPPADVIWSVLDGHGIPARIRGGYVGGYVGLALEEVRVEVPSDQAEAARALLNSVDRE